MIAESEVGVSVTATRQKLAGALNDMGNGGSGIAAFSATATAEVILPSVTGNLARSSQDAAPAAGANDTDSRQSATASTGWLTFVGPEAFISRMAIPFLCNSFNCFTQSIPPAKRPPPGGLNPRQPYQPAHAALLPV